MSSKLQITPKLSKFSTEAIYPHSQQPILTSPTSKSPTSVFRSDKKPISNPISINLSFLSPNQESPTSNKTIWASPQKSGRREKELEVQVATLKGENEKLHQIVKTLMATTETDEHKCQNELKLLTVRFTALEHEHIDTTVKNKQLIQEREKLAADNHLKDKEANSARNKMNEAFNRQLNLLGEISKLKAALMNYESLGLRSSFIRDYVSEGTSYSPDNHSAAKKELEERDAMIARLENEITLLRDQEARNKLAHEQSSKALERTFQLQSENITLKEAIQRLMKENQNLLDSITQLKARSLNDEIVQKVNELIQENQRLAGVMLNSNKEKDDLKAKLAQAEQQKNQMSSNEVTRLNQYLETLVKENDELTKKLLQFSQTVDTLRIQVTRLTEEKEEYRTRILQIYQATTAFEELNVKSSKLASDNQRLIELVTQKQHELEIAQAKLKESQDSGKKIEELKNQLIISNHDVERLSRTLKEKNEELDLYKKRNSDAGTYIPKNIWNKSAIFGDDFVRSDANSLTKSFSGQDVAKDYRKLQVNFDENERLRNYITPLSSDSKKLKALVQDVMKEFNVDNKKNLSDSRMTTVKDLSTEESFFDSFRKPSE